MMVRLIVVLETECHIVKYIICTSRFQFPFCNTHRIVYLLVVLNPRFLQLGLSTEAAVFYDDINFFILWLHTRMVSLAMNETSREAIFIEYTADFHVL